MPDDFTLASDFEGVEEMAYNFDKWLPRAIEGYAPQGRIVIPEPSTEAITTFMRDYTLLVSHDLDETAERRKKFAPPAAEDGSLIEETSEERHLRLSAMLTSLYDAATASLTERAELLSAACSGTPSTEEILALPARVRMAFEAYVIGKFDPEALSAATTS